MRLTPPSDRSLLLVIDEVQDLVPAEWKGLSDVVVRTVRAGGDTRLIALGDENQRVSPTMFRFEDLRGHLVRSGLPENEVCQKPLPDRSYRLTAQVAEVADSCLRPPVYEWKTRRAPTANAAGLDNDGEVLLLEAADPWREIEVAGGTLESREGRVRVLCRSPRADAPSALDPMTMSEAKGLEWEAVVVVDPLAGERLPLDYDLCTWFYTGLTRAKRRVLVAATHGEAEELRKVPVWRTLTLIQHLDAAVLERFREEVSVGELLRRLENVLGSGPPEQVANLAARACHAGGAHDLARLGASWLRGRPTDFDRIQAQAADLVLAGKLGDAAALMVFVGDFGSARLILEEVDPDSGLQRVGEGWRLPIGRFDRLVEEIRIALPAEERFRRAAHTLVAREFVKLARHDLSSTRSPTASAHPPEDPVTSRFEELRDGLLRRAERMSGRPIAECCNELEKRLARLEARCSEAQ